MSKYSNLEIVFVFGVLGQSGQDVRILTSKKKLPRITPEESLHDSVSRLFEELTGSPPVVDGKGFQPIFQQRLVEGRLLWIPYLSLFPEVFEVEGYEWQTLSSFVLEASDEDTAILEQVNWSI